eukprot:Polyplicarium_translucidae@DN1681_c0_g1_i1.p2
MSQKFRVAFFDSKPYDKHSIAAAARMEECDFDITFFDDRLNEHSVEIARNFDGICIFVNDKLDAQVAAALADMGVRLVCLRCAGFDRVDLKACEDLGISVTRVPAYSPHAVAEHAVGLLQCLNRKLHWAYNRVRDGNFTIDRLEGMTLYGKTVGVIGTGRIGQCFIDIMLGFGCRVQEAGCHVLLSGYPLRRIG